MYILCRKENMTLVAYNDFKESFKIVSLFNDSDKYVLEYNEISNANKYVIEVLDKDEIIHSVETDKSSVELILPTEKVENGKVYSLNVHAYNDDNYIESIHEEETLEWDEASFSSKNNTSLNNKKYTLKIDGELDKKHRLVIKSGKKTLYDKKITKNSFRVPTKYYLNKNVTLDFMLYNNDVLVSTFKATNKVKKTTTTTTKEKNPISKVVIKNKNIFLKEIKDIAIDYTGGDKATNKSIYIYEDNKLVKKELLTEYSYTITADILKKDKVYRVVVEASDDKFKRDDYIVINTYQNGRTAMVELASKQVGNDGKKYWKWWGFNGFVEWCAIFVSWVSNENGYIEAGILPKKSGCGSFVRWFKNRGEFKSRNSGYVPKPGDIIFFDYTPSNPIIDHVGIVEYSDGKYVYTIEGNTGTRPNTRALKKKYAINNGNIYGYGVPNY